MSKVLCRKAINFDLDTNALKEHYPGKNYRDAYSDIKDFMQKSGFEHRQWSGYVSNEKLSIQKVASVTQRLAKAFPWLQKCVNRFDVTDIGEQHDLTHLITGNVKEKVQEVKKEAVQAQKKQSFYSVKQLKTKAAEINRQPKVQNAKTKSKDLEL